MLRKPGARLNPSSAQNAARSPTTAAAEEIHQQDAAMHGQRRHQPRRPYLDAEHRVTGLDQPVQERRFIEIRFTLKIRHHPLAALEHLARDLGVTALVRLEEVERQARIQQDRRQQQKISSDDRRHGSRLAQWPPGNSTRDQRNGNQAGNERGRSANEDRAEEGIEACLIFHDRGPPPGESIQPSEMMPESRRSVNGHRLGKRQPPPCFE